MKENFKSGFVAIIGRPNVGKSTLMNHLIGQKIDITSKKPQTTRNKIQTVYTCEDGQIIFLDTPVQQFCDRVFVMHQGKIVEEGTPDEVIRNPKTEYTGRLIESVL